MTFLGCAETLFFTVSAIFSALALSACTEIDKARMAAVQTVLMFIFTFLVLSWMGLYESDLSCVCRLHAIYLDKRVAGIEPA